MPKVLVVDDDLTIRDLLKRVLRTEGYEVLTAETGEEGLEVIKKEGAENINLAFLDLKMPGMSGEALFEQMKATCEQVPVIIVTGHGNLDKWANLYRKNIKGYVTKPFNIEYIKMLARNNLR